MAEQLHDLDPQETQEWLESLDSVLEKEGAERAHFLVEKLVDHARQDGVNIPYTATTAYINTIPAHLQAKHPGKPNLEERILAYTRWNAAAMVVKANRDEAEPGGHISSFASAATLYDVGWNHFWHAPSANHGGDLVYFQGHSAPGVYSRAYLEGRITEDQLNKFRREVEGGGLSSYPHPWLMPDFWQFPTVSMGLGPLMAIYQARFMKYLDDRGFKQKGDRKVWCFCGDGEMDEPESLGAISLAGREKLDNLIFVINCNLQRLDGPVRGNGKIIQELEGDFRGSGWNVIKVVWGTGWDAILAQDKKGLLQKRMMEVVDGEYQTYKSKNGAYVREHFFGAYPELLDLVSAMSDDDIWRLTRGGNDLYKVYAAYKAAVEHKDQPTLLLVKTVKGFGVGAAGESQNVAHNTKKLSDTDLLYLRDRFNIPLTDEEAIACKFYRPADDSQELKHMHERRAELGGFVPSRKPVDEPLQVPGLDALSGLLGSTGEREMSTTMAFVRILNTLVKDKQIGNRIVPIVPDESRTFGMEGMFRQLGIWSHVGQLYEPQDADQLMFYKESKTGQVLQEGINEAGAMSDWIAAATSYANHGVTMIPFYIYYSMFGFQRIGDLAWAAGDLRARGFLVGGTAGRTTLNGEGLQHQDGHGHLFAEFIPNCVSYDPTFAYELAVIVQDGMRRMYQNQENIYYYLSVMNENYSHPAMPEGSEAGILRGMYMFQEGAKDAALKVQLMGSGTIFREVIAAAELLKADFGVDADIWSCPSFNELRRDGMAVERHNMLNPMAAQQVPYVTECLTGRTGPVIAATDYKRAFADQVREYVPAKYVVLGCDGYGRSDSRKALRSFFEVDRFHVAVAALKALADEGKIPAAKVAEAIEKYGIANRPAPWTV
ncbi:pyruvate dehydrogenase (acetyl-transferring), homodimeric type [Iodobacter fluviatilis]|uniref:Pyruvate dehydrogenase E1 component n=1 Tax=Iodobacter fluviatilis TaxID=537 RepID=A0A377Q565_9NEIS|nr:pyruvate dehydrogenase (acetyl-transferring), homodimeric type [Iodobacter fluviatilis]TCU84125.1 pyruvate dehydrogenase E1 component [Iodobacter fluviatilis]STQ89739.1 Pyruvate dehydrogenase E1 component [Iodobacter fluviatilis]